MAKTTIAAEGGRQKLVIYYDDLRALQFWVTTVLEEDSPSGVSNGQKFIAVHKRRRGPSDQAPVNVSDSNAEYLIDPSLKSGNARPGIPFRLQTSSLADVDETRQFTYTGRFIDLHAWLSSEITYPAYLYPANGGRHTLNVTIGGGD